MRVTSRVLLLTGLLVTAVIGASGGVARGGVPTQMPLDPDRGRDLYRVNCWQCHGYTGEGAGPVAASLPTTPPPLAGRIKEEDYDTVAALILSGKGDMPGYSQVMDRHDARRILVWLATLDAENPHDPADDKAAKDAADKAAKANKTSKVKDKDPPGEKAEGAEGAEGGGGEGGGGEGGDGEP